MFCKVYKKFVKKIELKEEDFEDKFEDDIEEVNGYTIIRIDGENELGVFHYDNLEAVEEELCELRDEYEIVDDDTDEHELNKRVCVIKGKVDVLNITSYKKFELK